MSFGTGALMVGRGPENFRAMQGGIHGNPMSRNHPCRQLPSGTVTLKPPYLPKGFENSEGLGA